MRLLHLTTLLAFTLYFQPLFAENNHDRFKSWESGPLTWDDFQIRVDGNTPSRTAIRSIQGRKKHLDGNLKYFSYDMLLQLDKDKSWYNPDLVSDNALLFHQTYFDIMEVERRLLINELNAHNRKEYVYLEVNHVYLNEFKKETQNGKDTAKVRAYSNLYKRVLDSIKIETPTAPEIIKDDWGMGLYIGYFHELYSPTISDIAKGLNGMSFGIDVIHNKLLMNFDFRGADSRVIADNVYYDDKLDYSWQKDKTLTFLSISGKAGYMLYDTPHYSLAPSIGVGWQVMRQQTGKMLSESQYEVSSIQALKVSAGVLYDWKYRRRVNMTSKNGYMESKIRFSLEGSVTNYKPIGIAYSLCLGAAFCIDTWNLL